MKLNLKNFFFFVILLIAGFFIGKFFVENYTSKKGQGFQNFSIFTPKPTPFAFEEMTIPYLRSREYKSELAELTKYSENSNYTSYLTSYDSDGLKINGLLTIPKMGMQNTKFPAIVFVHGYIAPTIYKTTEKYVDYVDYLARNGYVVFKIDLRGHGQSQGEAGGAYYSSDYVIDTLNAYSALEGANFVDGNKIGLWGHSMAGNVVSRAMAAKPNIPAVAIWAGAGYSYSDLLEFRITDNSYRPPEVNTQRAKRRQELREKWGDFASDSEFWKQVPFSNYLNDLKGAIALFHAIDDNVVSVEYSRNLNNLLNQTKVNHEYHEYNSGGHNITGVNFTKSFSDTVAFFDKYLK